MYDYKPTVLGVDFNNLFYASFYQPEFINDKGMNVNAIKSFFFKLRNLKQNLNPDKIIISKDVKRSNTLRRKLYPNYKAQRGSTPNDLIDQIPYAIELLELLGYPVLYNEAYEGDDILGMASRYCNYNGYDFIIASSDRDFFQLVNDNTFVFSMSKKKLYDTEEVMNQYDGLTPLQLIDLKAIMGDASDNIPGVRGIGPAIGTKLIKKYNSLDGVYEHINEIKYPIKDKLIMDKKNAYLSYMLGTIITDYTLINLKMEDLDRKIPNAKEVFNLINYLGLSEYMNMMMKYDFLN